MEMQAQAHRPRPDLLLLVGPKGSGKLFIGELLERELGLPEVADQRVPVVICVGRGGQHLAGEPALDDHREPVAIAIEQQRPRREGEAGALEQGQGCILSAGPIALITQGPLHRQIGAGAGRPVEAGMNAYGRRSASGALQRICLRRYRPGWRRARLRRPAG